MIDRKKVNIVLVEDNINDSELIMRHLKQNNLANDVRLMKDGSEVLEYLFGKDGHDGIALDEFPHLIILDLKLPKVSGLDVLRRLKSEEKTKTIPVVILTSSTEEQDLIESYKFGVNSYISKPVNFKEFVEAVSQLGLYWLILNKEPHAVR